MPKKYHLHINDLSPDIYLEGDIAVDTETMGLHHHRDRLCLVQLCDVRNNVHIVQFTSKIPQAPMLKQILSDNTKVKIFHYARFDLAIIQKFLRIKLHNIFCTKVASKLCRTYTQNHSLKDLCKSILDVTLSKEYQSSDWGAVNLTEEQIRYAAQDVEFLHILKKKLSFLLQREQRLSLAQRCFQFLELKAELDLLGWGDDLFLHH